MSLLHPSEADFSSCPECIVCLGETDGLFGVNASSVRDEMHHLFQSGG